MNRGQVASDCLRTFVRDLGQYCFNWRPQLDKCEHPTSEIEFSFSYASVLLGQRRVTEFKLALVIQPYVTRVRTDPNNCRLAVEI